ncbi:putative transmembrane protein, partial [Chlamydia psittaci C1/97]
LGCSHDSSFMWRGENY